MFDNPIAFWLDHVVMCSMILFLKFFIKFMSKLVDEGDYEEVNMLIDHGWVLDIPDAKKFLYGTCSESIAIVQKSMKKQGRGFSFFSKYHTV